MGIPVHTTPPDARTNYIIDQLEGERITIPGSKGAFRILASSKQTDGGIAVFQSGAVLSDAPGFHWHSEAHDVFLVTKGYLKLWNGDKCRIMGPGDFAYVPPVSTLNSNKQSHTSNERRKSFITQSFGPSH
jgi:mannose-6-phosphate isomerase-like protein (cupin superfamily)